MLPRPLIAGVLSVSLVTQLYSQTLWSAQVSTQYLKIYLDHTGLSQSSLTYDQILANVGKDLHPQDLTYFKSFAPQLKGLKINQTKTSDYSAQSGQEQVNLSIGGKSFLISVDGRQDISQALPTVKVVGGSKGQNLRMTIKPEDMTQEDMAKALGLPVSPAAQAPTPFVMLSRQQFLKLGRSQQMEYVKRLADVMTAAEQLSSRFRAPAAVPKLTKPPGKKGATRYHWSQSLSWGDIVLDRPMPILGRQDLNGEKIQNEKRCLSENIYLQPGQSDCETLIRTSYTEDKLQPCVIGGYPGKVIQQSCVPDPEQVNAASLATQNKAREAKQIGALNPGAFACNPLIYGHSTGYKGGDSEINGILVTDGQSGCTFPGGNSRGIENTGDPEQRLSEIFLQYKETHKNETFDQIKKHLEQQIKNLQMHCSSRDKAANNKSPKPSFVASDFSQDGLKPQSIKAPWWLSVACANTVNKPGARAVSVKASPVPAAAPAPVQPLQEILDTPLRSQPSIVSNIANECSLLDQMLARLNDFTCNQVVAPTVESAIAASGESSSTKELKAKLGCGEPTPSPATAVVTGAKVAAAGGLVAGLSMGHLLLAGIFGAIAGALLRGKKTRYVTKTETVTKVVEKNVPGETIYLPQPPVYIDRPIPVRVEIPVPGPAVPPVTRTINYTPPVRATK